MITLFQSDARPGMDWVWISKPASSFELSLQLRRAPPSAVIVRERSEGASGPVARSPSVRYTLELCPPWGLTSNR